MRKCLTNVFLQQDAVPRMHGEAQNGHRGAIVWLTGFPRVGKSTLAYSVEKERAMIDSGI
jgi:adenylylsulfate kinase